MLVVCCRLFIVRCLCVRRLLLFVGCWLFFVVWRLLIAGCSLLFDVCCVCRVLFVVWCALCGVCVVRCVMCVMWCGVVSYVSLCVVRCVRVVVIRCSLIFGYCLMRVACCVLVVLFVVRCVQLVVCYFLFVV